jgi:hypothetical protein
VSNKNGESTKGKNTSSKYNLSMKWYVIFAMLFDIDVSSIQFIRHIGINIF